MMIQSADEFVRLRSSPEQRDYSRAATEEAAPGVWLEVIERYPEFRKWVAHNKTVPLDVLRVLAADPDPSVRMMVALKGKLTADLLEQLSEDPDEGVRIRVAMHRRTSIDVRRRLAQDESSVVRREAEARINKLPAE